MPPNVSLFRTVVGLIVAASLGGMVAAQVWAFARLAASRPLLTRSPTRPVPWGLGGVVAVVLLYVLLSGAVKVGYLSLRGPAGPEVASTKGPDTGPGSVPKEGTLSFTEVMLLVSIVNGVSLLAVPAVLWMGRRASFEDLGLTTHDFLRNVGTGLVGFLLVAPWVYAVNAAAVFIYPQTKHPLESMLREGLSPSAVVLAIVSAVVLAPAAEELIFRGALLGWMSKPRDGEETSPSTRADDWPPIVLSSLLFAAVHASEMPAPFAIFLLSLALGRIARSTGSLVGPLVLHSSFNAFSTLMLIASSAL